MNKRTLTFTLCLLCICSAFSCSPDDYEDETSDMFNENESKNESEAGLRAPTGVFIYQNGEYIYLSWDAVADATFYTVYSSESANGPWEAVTTTVTTQVPQP